MLAHIHTAIEFLKLYFKAAVGFCNLLIDPHNGVKEVASYHGRFDEFLNSIILPVRCGYACRLPYLLLLL